MNAPNWLVDLDASLLAPDEVGRNFGSPFGSLQEEATRIARLRVENVEHFIAQYLVATGIPITELELVEVHEPGLVRWFVRRKQDNEES